MFTLVSTRTSSLFLQSYFVLRWPPGCGVVMLKGFIPSQTQHLACGLNLVSFPSVHFSSLFLSKRAALPSSVSTILLQFVFLSENLLVVQSVPLPRSLIRMLNSTSISPWRMPLVIYCELRLLYWSQHVHPTWTLVPLFFHSPLSTYLYVTNRHCVKSLAQLKVCSIQCCPIGRSAAGCAWYAFCKSRHLLLLHVLRNDFKEDCFITFPGDL